MAGLAAVSLVSLTIKDGLCRLATDRQTNEVWSTYPVYRPVCLACGNVLAVVEASKVCSKVTCAQLYDTTCR